ncbi:MAG: SLC13 family permease [Acetobacteraceae bacterium]|nr:SLC13 family permease [Acetobacteraceae bacterium]
MTTDQILSFSLLGLTIAAFAWGRLPYDLVALTSLGVGLVVGIIPAKHAFEGFSDDVVIIIAAALVVSAAIARSGVVEAVMRPITARLTTTATQVPVLSACCMALSMVTKNVGALAVFMPVALQICRRNKTPASAVLMPMAFSAMLGGVVTMVGTAPNILIAKVRADTIGKPFGLFDFTPVGLTVALAGLVFVSFAWGLLPRGRRGASGLEAAFNLEDYTAEANVPAKSAVVGRTIAEVEAMAEGDVQVAMVIRERFRRLPPRADSLVRENDLLLLRGEPSDLDRLVARADVQLAGAASGEAQIVEGVVTAESSLVGRTLAQAQFEQRHEISVMAVSRSGQRIGQRLATVRLRAGDVIVLRSASPQMADTLGALHILPLAHRSITLGRNERSLWPALVLVAAMGLVAAHVLTVGVAFFLAAVVMLLMRTMTMHEAYETVEWHVLILLGALIPVTHALHDTGGTALLANLVLSVVQGLPGPWALGFILVVTLIVTPFLHNAPTVLIMGPIAASVATKLEFSVDPFLMAVALGAGCDFLSPLGHQCNTLVMGPGGYRFADYPRLGAPLSLIVILVGLPMILWVWPLHG